MVEMLLLKESFHSGPGWRGANQFRKTRVNDTLIMIEHKGGGFYSEKALAQYRRHWKRRDDMNTMLAEFLESNQINNTKELKTNVLNFFNHDWHVLAGLRDLNLFWPASRAKQEQVINEVIQRVLGKDNGSSS
jgi:hypothetical protein